MVAGGWPAEASRISVFILCSYDSEVAVVGASRIINFPKEFQWLREGGRPGPRESLFPLVFLWFLGCGRPGIPTY